MYFYRANNHWNCLKVLYRAQSQGQGKTLRWDPCAQGWLDREIEKRDGEREKKKGRNEEKKHVVQLDYHLSTSLINAISFPTASLYIGQWRSVSVLRWGAGWAGEPQWHWGPAAKGQAGHTPDAHGWGPAAWPTSTQGQCTRQSYGAFAKVFQLFHIFCFTLILNRINFIILINLHTMFHND